MKRLFAKVLAALAVLLAAPAVAQPVDTGHLVAELVARDASIAPGATTYVAVRQKIDKGWHTYWRNSGDSGQATTVAWTLPPGWKAGDIVWPAPERQPTGPLMNYGYKDEVLLPIPVTAPAGARAGETVTLKAVANFLVCEEICIPEQAELTLSLPVADGLAKPDPRWGDAIAATMRAEFDHVYAIDVDRYLNTIVVGTELTLPELSQTVILTRTGGKASPMPESERLEVLGASGATLAIHLSVRNLNYVEQALTPHYGADCPVVVVYRATWPDELILHTTLHGMRAAVREAKITRTALVFVGEVFGSPAVKTSRLYDATFAHVLRNAGKKKDRGSSG